MIRATLSAAILLSPHPGVSYPGVAYPGVSYPGVPYLGVRYLGVHYLGVLASATSEPTPTEAECHGDSLCQLVYRETGIKWLAEGAYYALVKPGRILAILIGALVLRFILHRIIKRLTRRALDGRRGVLRRRAKTAPVDAGVRAERNRQRADSLTSVLRSITSATLFTVALMLILAEVGVNVTALIASAGIIGAVLGFGAQHLIKDFIAGLFMLIEDQYGIGDVVDLGEARGTVEAVGLRITTVRDLRGVLWYVRNGEIVRVGNRSQGWAQVVVDVPIGFADADQAMAVLREAAQSMASDAEFEADLLDRPDVLGVEDVTVDGAWVRTTAKATADAQWRVGRELRRRLTEALAAAGITDSMTANRVYVRPPTPQQRPGSGAASGGQSPS